jgi:hypothetical protein
MASHAAAGPAAQRIWRTCAEWAEAGWLAARGRGMADPVVELWALDEADPGWVVVAVAGRERLAHKLAPLCPPAVAYLRAAPPSRPFSVVILTPSGVNVDHRMAPGGPTTGSRPPTMTRRRGRRGLAGLALGGLGPGLLARAVTNVPLREWTGAPGGVPGAGIPSFATSPAEARAAAVPAAGP